MDTSVMEKALDFSFAFPCTHSQLGFFGGEPLLQWDLLKAATLIAEEKARKADSLLLKTVTTNGVLLHDEKAQWLIDHSFVSAVSIDGNQRMHDLSRPFKGGKSSFNSVIKGLRVLQKYRPQTEVIVVVTPFNVSHLFEGVSYLCEEENILKISINPDFYDQWSKEDLDIWYSQSEKLGDYYIERYSQGRPLFINFIDGKIITHLKNGFENCDKCGFGQNEIAVAPSGNIYPCERLVGEDSNDEMCIGNVFDGFDDEKRQSILNARGCINTECSDCHIRNRCMNWCCCINYGMTGQINVTDGLICFHEQMAVSVADRVANFLYGEKNPWFISRYYGGS
jgi:uncharacterized protein